MLKRASQSAAVVLAALVALPAASQANHDRRCAELDRVGAGITRVADEVGHTLRRVGEGLRRVGDRTVGVIFHDRRR